mmetsp:Transcript_8297/g.9646  ORF Transcript_8297/g.9646 Transcript_8297/m.9646 type:complete len:689 (+) Transcript_8297:42-2108(+)
MAQLNPFAALEGNGSHIVADPTGKKKKNKNKKKPVEETVEVPAVRTVEQPVVQESQGKSKKKGKAPQAMAEEAFQAAPASQSAKSTTSEGLAKNLQSAAASALDDDARVKLWKDWTRQAHDSTAKYTKGAETVDFKQVMLSCNALETTVQGCFTTPVAPKYEDKLQGLLVAVLPPCGQVASTLSRTIVQLSEMLTDEGSDLVSAGKAAVLAVIRTLKAGPAKTDDLLPKVEALDREVSDRQRRLQELEVAAQGSTAPSPQLTRYATELFRLSEDKVSLLSSGTVATSNGSGNNTSSGNALEFLRQFTSMAKICLDQATSEQSNRKTMNQGDALKEQAAKLATDIAACERQLANLKKQAEKVQAQRQALASGKSVNMTQVNHAAQYSKQIEIIKSVESELVNYLKATSPSQSGPAKNVLPKALAGYLMSLEVFLRYKQEQMVGFGDRLTRLVKNVPVGQAQNLKALGDQLQTQQQKVLEKTKGLIKETVSSSAEVVQEVRAAKASLDQRAHFFTSVPGYGAAAVRIREAVDNIAKVHQKIQESGESPASNPAALEAQITSLTASLQTLTVTKRAAPAPAAEVKRPTTAPVEAPPDAKGQRNRKGRKGKGPEGDETNGGTAGSHAVSAVAPPAAAATRPASAPAAKPAAPAKPARTWGKPAGDGNIVVDESLPSLSDSMGAAKGKRRGKA